MRITYENLNQIMELKLNNEQIREMRRFMGDEPDLIRAFLDSIYNQIDADLEKEEAARNK